MGRGQLKRPVGGVALPYTAPCPEQTNRQCILAGLYKTILVVSSCVIGLSLVVMSYVWYDLRTWFVFKNFVHINFTSHSR
jgi:hypothetical protein